MSGYINNTGVINSAVKVCVVHDRGRDGLVMEDTTSITGLADIQGASTKGQRCEQ